MNNIRTIDTRSLSCPQPLMLAYDALVEKKEDLHILVDNEASKENIIRAATKYGWKISTQENDGITTIILNK